MYVVFSLCLCGSGAGAKLGSQLKAKLVGKRNPTFALGPGSSGTPGSHLAEMSHLLWDVLVSTLHNPLSLHPSLFGLRMLILEEKGFGKTCCYLFMGVDAWIRCMIYVFGWQIKTSEVWTLSGTTAFNHRWSTLIKQLADRHFIWSNWAHLFLQYFLNCGSCISSFLWASKRYFWKNLEVGGEEGSIDKPVWEIMHPSLDLGDSQWTLEH